MYLRMCLQIVVCMYLTQLSLYKVRAHSIHKCWDKSQQIARGSK